MAPILWDFVLFFLGKLIQQTKKQFQNVVSSHPDPIPVLLSVKHLQEQLVLLKGKASKIINQYFAAAVRAQQSSSMDPLYFGLGICLRTVLKVVMSREEGRPAGACDAHLCLPGVSKVQVTRVNGQGLSLTFVFNSVLHCFKSCCLQGFLMAGEPVKPPSPQLPELRVAGHEPVRAVPLVQGRLLQRVHAHQHPGARAGVLQGPGVYDPNPAHLLQHGQGLVSGGPTRTLLENQAGPLQ